MKTLPWSNDRPPLMLAPMQGLTNRAMRALFIDLVRPDVVFTEFMRVSNVSRKRLVRNDLTSKPTASTSTKLASSHRSSGTESPIGTSRPTVFHVSIEAAACT